MFGYGRVPFALPLHRHRRHPQQPPRAAASGVPGAPLPSALSPHAELPTTVPPMELPARTSALLANTEGSRARAAPRTESLSSTLLGQRSPSPLSPQPWMPSIQGWAGPRPRGAGRHPESFPRGSLQGSPMEPGTWLPLLSDSPPDSPLWSLFAPSSPVPWCSGETEQLRACSQAVSACHPHPSSPGYSVCWTQALRRCLGTPL